MLLLVLLVLAVCASAQNPASAPMQFALARPTAEHSAATLPPAPPTEFEHFNLAPARSRRGVARLTWDLDRPSALPALEVGKRPVLSADRQMVRPDDSEPKPPLKTRLKRFLTSRFR